MYQVIGADKEEVFVYKMIENFIDNNKTVSYGIKVFRKGECSNKHTNINESVTIQKISSDKNTVKNIIKILSKNLVMPIHCQQIIEELISDVQVT